MGAACYCRHGGRSRGRRPCVRRDGARISDSSKADRQRSVGLIGGAVHLETLQVFCDLVESGSFSVAASQNFITQSAVSQQVRALETRFDQPLIERTKGHVQPTPAGQLLYQVSKEITGR